MELVFLSLGEHHVGQDAQDQSAGDGGQGDLAEGNGQAADAGDQDHSSNEQVLAGTQVDLLDHLQTGNCDEAVQGDADTAHDAVGDGSQEGNEGSEEGDNDTQDSSGGDGSHGSVPGNGNTADGLAVGGVGAAAEESTGDGANAVTQQGVVQAGLSQQILADDGGQVLVVSDVLSEDNECNGNVSNSNSGDESAVDFLNALQSLDEGEVGNCEDLHVGKDGEVDDLQSHIVGEDTDDGEDSSHNIANQDAQDEGDQLSHLLAVDGEEDNSKQGSQTADQSNIGAAGGNAVNQNLTGGQVADSIGSQGQADDGNGGSNDHGGHQLVDPVNANSLDDQSDNHINQASEDSAEDQAGVTGRNRSSTAEGSEHRANEGEGRAQENGAVPLGEELVNQGADAGAEQGGGLAHAVADDAGNSDGSSQDGQNLLECEQQHLSKLRLVFDTVDQIHENSSNKFLSWFPSKKEEMLPKRTAFPPSSKIPSRDSILLSSAKSKLKFQKPT